jgi:hypothetical protein
MAHVVRTETAVSSQPESLFQILNFEF